MSELKDTYKTITKPSDETLFKDRNSKFLGYAFPITSDKEVKQHLDELKKKHHSARHHCYAWQLGVEDIRFRANDDGEPSNTAGQPIYGQIQAFELTNVLVVSVRYFGGTKLGVGGLINAYKTSAKITLEASEIIEKTIDVKFKLKFDYSLMNNVQRIIKEKNIRIANQKLELDCQYTIAVRKKEAQEVFNAFKSLFKIEIKRLD